MGNSFSGISDYFNKPHSPDQLAETRSLIVDQPEKETYASKGELEKLNHDLKDSVYQLTSRIQTLTNVGELMSPFKSELNSFYSVVNEQSEVNLEDHERMHEIIGQLQQEIFHLKKEMQILKNQQHDDFYEQQYEIDHAPELEMEGEHPELKWDHSGENFHQDYCSESSRTISPAYSDNSALTTETPPPSPIEKPHSPSLSVKEFILLEKKLKSEEALEEEAELLLKNG